MLVCLFCCISQIYLSASISPEHPSYVSDDVMMSSDVGSILRCYVNGSDMSEILTTDGEPRGIVLSGEGRQRIQSNNCATESTIKTKVYSFILLRVCYLMMMMMMMMMMSKMGGVRA